MDKIYLSNIFLTTGFGHNNCLLKPESCNRHNACAAHMVWQKARKQLRETLRDATFAKLLQENSCYNPLEIQEDGWHCG